MIIALSMIFCAIGILSTFIGLGGGTFYLIFMDLFQLPTVVIPVLSLTSNIVVSGIGASARLLKSADYDRVALPKILVLLLMPSMISAYFAASIRIQDSVFRIILNITLMSIILTRIVLQRKISNTDARERELPHIRLAILSACVGFVSGLIGIGGGIILGPILYLYGISYTRIPLITAIYICLNSAVGLIVQFQKIPSLDTLTPYLILPAISILSSIVSMKYIAFRIHSKQIVNLVIATMGVISLYNIIRLVEKIYA